MSGDHNQYQKPNYVDRRQWKYDPMTGEPVAKYSDIVSDGGLDPRNKFDNAPKSNDFVRGYRQGFSDAKYIYDLKEGA